MTSITTIPSDSFTPASPADATGDAAGGEGGVAAAAAAFLEVPSVRAAIQNLAIEILRTAPQDFQWFDVVSHEACSHLMEALVANSDSVSSRASSPASSCCCEEEQRHHEEEQRHQRLQQPPHLPPGGGNPDIDDDGAPPAKISASTSFFTSTTSTTTTTTTATTTTTTAAATLSNNNNNNSNSNNNQAHQTTTSTSIPSSSSSFASMSERASQTISDIQNGTAEFAAKSVLPRLAPGAMQGADLATVVEDVAATAASIILTITAANVKRLETYILAESSGSEDGQRLAASVSSECTEIVFETIQLLASYLERHGVTPQGAVAIAEAAYRRVADLVRQKVLEQQQQDRAIPCGAEECDSDFFPAQQVPC